jgi:hypothetical protein
MSEEDDNGEAFEVERILADRIENGVRMFLISWKGKQTCQQSKAKQSEK